MIDSIFYFPVMEQRKIKDLEFYSLTKCNVVVSSFLLSWPFFAYGSCNSPQEVRLTFARNSY